MEAEHRGRSIRRWAVGAVAAAAVALLVVPVALGLPLAVGHAQLHAMFALGALLPAIAIAWRSRRPSLASTAPFAGFVLFGLAQVIESLGGLGYGPGNDVRVNALATVHDIGLGATLVGLAGVVLGLTVGVGAAIRRRTNRPVVAVASGVAVLLVGGFAAAKLVGM